jgi:putative ABC transport system ATP-binding protein
MARVVSLSELRFTWPGSPRPVLDIERLDIDRGQHLFVQGASGSGKTTLLSLLTGINQPDAGKLEVLGQDLAEMSSIRRDRFRADHLGVIFQQFNLLPFLGILDNVMLPCRFSPRRRKRAGDVGAAAHQMLDELQIADGLRTREVMQLSVGQQQRVAVARALIGNPEIVIADEPTSALDSDNRDAFIDLLFRRASEHGSTLLFVSHDRHLAAHFDHRIDLGEINRAQHEMNP